MPRFRRNLWLLLGQNAAVFLGIALQGLVFNLYLVQLGYREDFVGLVAFAQTAAIGGGAMPAGWLSPRLGPRRLLMLGTGLLAFSFAAMALIESPVLLLIAAALNGVAMANIFVPSAPFLMENSRSDERRAAFAANFAALAVASVAGNAIGGYLPGLVGGAEAAGYRAALVAGAALTVLGIVPLLLADDRRIAEPAQPTAPGGGGPLRASRADMVAMSLATAFLAASSALVVAFFNVFLRDVVGSSTAAIGNVFALGSVMMAPASLGAPALARRWGAVPVIAISRLACAPLFLLLMLPRPSLEIAAGVFIARMALISIGQPLDNAFAMDLVGPRERARVAAIRTVSWNGGWAIATALGGLAIVWLGYPAIFLAAVLLTIASVTVHWRAFSGR